MIYVGIIAAIFLLEFCIKTLVEKKRKLNTTKPILGGKLLLRKHHNKGVVLNIGQEKPKVVAYISLGLCIGISLVALLFGNKGNKLMKTGLAMVLGGAYSNTYDRIFRTYVVDYFSFGVKNPFLRRIIFNLADFCIMVGAILVVIGGIGDENIGKRQICGTRDGGLGGPQ